MRRYFDLSADVKRALIAQAESQWPNEACGWIRNSHVRNADNVHSAPDRFFAFSAADLIAFASECDSNTPPTALYHSHPNGIAQMSASDLQSAVTAFGPAYPVAQVIIAGVHDDWRFGVWSWDVEQQGFAPVNHQPTAVSQPAV